MFLNLLVNHFKAINHFKIQNEINIFSGIFNKTLNVTCSSKLNSNHNSYMVCLHFQFKGSLNLLAELLGKILQNQNCEFILLGFSSMGVFNIFSILSVMIKQITVVNYRNESLHILGFFSSPELKAQVSYSDRPLSVVLPCVCM